MDFTQILPPVSLLAKAVMIIIINIINIITTIIIRIAIKNFHTNPTHR